ncbi:hypothetical protein NE857_14375 [Nocardiopsis exhalans]|uniref:YD repeat-containing protein n=1 Tax=Nocardiopsis exhalans TaxID=163604 RepID=A0ABY5DI35_9ACTN|nr:hypothetical protein [Nocardiopsis exhalans]USY22685.1 hypothetical protein NE857_14375 [Nocardiopsis exhalans]
MSDIPRNSATRRRKKPFTSFLAVVMVAGLASTVPASALSYNDRPDVNLEESVAGSDAVQAAISTDSAVADAAVSTLDQPAWPEAETVVFGEAAESHALSAAGEGGPVLVEGVSGEEFEQWVSPLPDVAEPDDVASERRAPAEPESEIPQPEQESTGEENSEPEVERPSPQPEPEITPLPEDEAEEPEPESSEAEDQPAGPVTSAQVEVLDRAAATELGLSGLALRVTRLDEVEESGPVRVEVDYSGFASAYGADYGSRLQLVALTECEDPESTGCWSTHELDAHNDPGAQTLTALAPATTGGTLLAAVASGSGEEGTGDYGATPLNSSSTWNIGVQTGDFSWSYPMETPQVAGGLQPQISLGYSSQSVDGRTSDTNNQTSWIGEGFDYHPGYIERQYKLCQDDGDQIPDLCWSRHNATLNLGGRATELLYVDGDWVPKNDDGSKIERLTGATNGDNDGEHWKVTTTDGTQYYFGLNRLPGHSSGDEETNSAWTVPVFGNDSGEPCHKSNLDDAWCDQAWRWNLDYVVDLHGNALAHYYQAENNNYGLNFSSDPVEYDRGGYLKRTAYGLRDNNAQATAPAQVVYSVGERCVDEDFGCKAADRKESNAKYWPDTPLDQECDDDCAGQHNATFWTTKKLNKITTQLHDGDGYVTVDSWELKHSFPAPGDGTDPALWLDSITHTGHTGDGTESMPAVTFAGTPMPNRIDSTTDGLAPMNKWRITAVYTETGGQVDISYAEPACDPASLPAAHTNTEACFPVIRTHRGGADDITDWFAKYVVTELVEVDLVGGQPDVITSYDYVGDGAWRYMDADGFVREDRRTWSQWRGFDRVIVRKGHPDEVRTETEYLFYQGMDGDHLLSGKRSVSVSDSTGTSVTDDEVFNGQTREVIARDGVDGEVVSKAITTPWKRKTAERTFSWGTVEAHMLSTKQTDAYTALQDGSFRQTRTVNTFDEFGMVTSVHDQGDVTDDTDDQCTTTTFARNTGLHLLDLVARTRTVAVACGEQTSVAEGTIADTRFVYDGKNYGQAPTRGLVSQTERLAEHEGETSEYQVVSTSAFDSFGRPLETTDAQGHTTTIEYSDVVAGGAPKSVVTTNPLGHEQTISMDHRSKPLAIIDAEGNKTEVAYDSLGRITDVWLADRTGAASMSPSMSFEYNITKNAPSSVVSRVLGPDGDYVTGIQILDGFLRERQTQNPAPGGGRVLTDVFYDSRGNAVIEREPYFNEQEPGQVLFVVNNHDEIPRWARTHFDGSGRATDIVSMSRGVEQWSTSIEHQGDRTLVTEPEGGVGSTSITDARGRLVERRDHHGPEPEQGPGVLAV